MASCILTEGKSNLLCSLVTQGQDAAIKKLLEDVCQEQEAIVTLETFSQCSHMYNEMVPIVLAAQHGHINLVKYLVNLVPQEQFVNTVSTVYGIANSGDELHHVTALIAACIRGHLSIIKFLVEHNASLSIPDCTGSTPLCEAVFHGRLNIVEYLCEQGADINTTNDFGWQSIHIAALKDNCMAYKCLIEHNADASCCTPDGFTPLHIAAQTGNVKIFTQNMDFDQAVKNSFHNEIFVPSPLNLAAAYSGHSWTHQKIVNKIIQASNCSELNKCDAYLLMGVSHFLVEEHSKTFFQWQKAVEIFEKSLLQNSCSEIFGRKEVRTTRELSQLRSSENPFGDVEMWYQVVLIWEKRIGFCDMTYWEILHNATEKIKSKPDQEMLLLRGMEMVDQYLLPRLSHGFILPENFEQFFDSWIRNCFIDNAMCKFETSLSLSNFVSCLLKIAKVISLRFNSLSSTYGCKRRSPLKILSIILKVFDMWLKSKFSTEIDPFELGVQFVEDFLILNNNSSILHYIIEMKLFSDFTIFEFLVQCGASRALNLRCKGKMCLHIACISGDIKTIAFLCDIGAHIDAVDEQGCTPLYVIQELHPNKVNEFVSRFCFSPLLLQCLSAKAILKHGVYFDSLPQTVQDFIYLHCEA